jgi:hypothetical protein
MEEYTRSFGSNDTQRVVLGTKGLRAMNAVPSPLKETLGTALQNAVESSSGGYDWSQIGDLIGGIFAEP